jgi:hypothetical protein
MAVGKRTSAGAIPLFVLLLLAVWVVFEFTKTPPISGDWQPQFSVPSIAEFNDDLVTVRNVRNFRYYPEETDMHPGYYDRKYDLSKIKGAWYTTEPWNENKLAGHTYVTFEFENGDFLAITIEARKTKNQLYSVWKALFRTYPLIYVAVDERDATLMRANIRKDKVYVYPVKLSDPKNSRILLTNMLTEMNRLSVNPRWYNTLFSNCTSEIAKQVNKITPGRISMFSWQLWLTASADELALKNGLLDTDLPIEKAREKFFVTEKSKKIGDVPHYSKSIRE